MTYKYPIRLSEKYTYKIKCPVCNGGQGDDRTKKTFKPYKDVHSGQLYPYQFGRCDRQKCSANQGVFPDKEARFEMWQKLGYITNSQTTQEPTIKKWKDHKLYKKPMAVVYTKERQNIYIDKQDYLKCSIPIPEQQQFITFLKSYFPETKIRKTLKIYGVRSLKSNPNILCYPFVDPKKQIHDIQCTQHDNGKKNTRIHPLWIHYDTNFKQIRSPQWINDFKKQSESSPRIMTMFGAHLLNDTENTIVITEGAKTAILGKLVRPDITWVATSSSQLCHNRFRSIEQQCQDRYVLLIPDSGAYDKWYNATIEINHLYFPNTNNCLCIDIMEAYKPNTDIGDLIIENKAKTIKLLKNIIPKN